MSATATIDSTVHISSLDEDALFGDLVTEAPIPTMPSELEPFNIFINNALARQYGEEVFLVWLRAHLTDKEVEVPKPLEPKACQSNPEIFFAEFPDVEDDMSDWFGKNPESTEFLRAEAQTDIAMAQAKAECFSCTLRPQCLSSAVVDFQEYGVWGGWGPGGRNRIFNQFSKIRREYNAGRLSTAETRRLEKAAFSLELDVFQP